LLSYASHGDRFTTSHHEDAYRDFLSHLEDSGELTDELLALALVKGLLVGDPAVSAMRERAAARGRALARARLVAMEVRRTSGADQDRWVPWAQAFLAGADTPSRRAAVLRRSLLAGEDPLSVLLSADALESSLEECSLELTSSGAPALAVLVPTWRIYALGSFLGVTASPGHLLDDLEALVLAHVLASSPALTSPDAGHVVIAVPAEFASFLLLVLRQAEVTVAGSCQARCSDFAKTAETALALLPSNPDWSTAWLSAEALES
jgi:hypothetical protein